jgi:hypothetical protein
MAEGECARAPGISDEDRCPDINKGKFLIPQKERTDGTGRQSGIHAFQMIAGGQLDCEL